MAIASDPTFIETDLPLVQYGKEFHKRKVRARFLNRRDNPELLDLVLEDGEQAIRLPVVAFAELRETDSAGPIRRVTLTLNVCSIENEYVFSGGSPPPPRKPASPSHG